MSTKELDMKTFSTRVRQLILSYKELKQENGELYAMVDKKDKELEELKQKLEEQTKKYETLMMAKMLNVGDNDLETTRKRVNKLIRSVNQCITLLSENK